VTFCGASFAGSGAGAGAAGRGSGAPEGELALAVAAALIAGFLWSQLLISGDRLGSAVAAVGRAFPISEYVLLLTMLLRLAGRFQL